MGTLAQLDCVPRSSRKEHKMQRRSDLTAAEKKAWGRTTFHKDEAEFKINWLHAFILTWTPALALYGAFTTELRLPTLALAVFFYFFTGMGITAGYHRLFSHKAYKTLKVEVGKDVSAYFRGEARSTDGSLNQHTQDARAMLKDLVVARLDGLLRLPEEE